MKKTIPADQRYLIRPCTVVYVVLIALTIVTWMIGKTGISGQHVAILVLLFALLKGLLIGDYYMGLRGIRGFWRWPIILWLLVPGSLISWAFIIAA